MTKRGQISYRLSYGQLALKVFVDDLRPDLAILVIKAARLNDLGDGYSRGKKFE